MDKPFRFDYYYGAESDQFSYVRIPKHLLKDPKFQDLSYGAIVVYAILLDRMNLSIKNGWHDEKNRVYIRYKVSDLTEVIGRSEDTVSRYLKELEDIGLIERPRVGLGKGKVTYVKNFISPGLRDGDLIPRENAGNVNDDKNDFSMIANGKASGTAFIGVSEPAKLHITRECAGNVSGNSAGNIASKNAVNVTRENAGNVKSNTENNNININNTETYPNHICRSNNSAGSDEDWMRYRSVIKDHIDYDNLCLRKGEYTPEEIDGIVDIMTEVMVCNKPMLWIAGCDHPTSMVKERFMKIRCDHIEYILDCFHKNTSKIYNIKKYLQAAIFNAPTTIESYYQAEVNHDMFGWD